MSKLRRKFIAALAVLFCALLCLSAALMIPKNKSAEAYSETQTANVSELYIGGDNVFSAKNLKALYGKLVSGATQLNDIKNALPESNSTLSVADFASGNKNIVVEFGGMEWSAVYLSKATTTYKNVGGAPADNALGEADADDIVLTLWLANPTQTSQWNKSSDGASGTYPCHMYGSSYIRSVTLNNGGKYWKDVNGLYSDPGKKATNEFARFNMSTYTENGVTKTSKILNYLVSPRYISWQYSQSYKETILDVVNLNNDAWGTENGGEDFMPGIYLGDNPYYSVWKDDLLWIPSLVETGNSDGDNGIWGTTFEMRRSSGSNSTWLRSADGSCFDYVISLTNLGAEDSCLLDNKFLVRPALHLNLTKAAESAKGLTFDGIAAGSTERVYEYVYDGVSHEVKIPDYDKLNIYGGDKLTNYSESTGVGVFYATLPAEHDDKTYEINVKPQTGYIWDDSDTSEERKYKIKIKAEGIIASFENSIKRTLDNTLLQSSNLIKSTSEALGDSVTFTEKYYIASPRTDTSLPSNVQWTERDDNGEYFKTKETGVYYVYYQIEAQYHKTTAVSCYTVTVANETLTVSVNGDGIIGSANYSENDDNLKSQSWLKSEFAKNVTITTSTDVTYNTEEAIKEFLNNPGLEIYLYTDNSAEAELNSYVHYDAGTYYLGLKDTNTSYVITWSNDRRPSFEITPKQIKVYLVDKDGGENLSHVYGYAPNKIFYKDYDDIFTEEINATFAQTFKILEVIEGDSTLVNSVLGQETPVGIYMIEGSVGGNRNFDVNFDDTEYVVEKRPVTLKVANETIVYGTSLNGYRYKTLTDVNKSLPTWDKASALSAEYYLTTQDGKDVAKSDTLAVGEYVLCVRVDNNNYEFEYVFGTFTVTKATLDMSAVKLENAGYVYDGKPHAAQISGTLPEGVSVSYEYYLGGEKLDGIPTEKGLYTVYAKFTLADTDNYNEIPDKLAYLKIAATQAELDKGFPDEAPDPDGNNKDNGGETPDPNPNPNPTPDPSVNLESKKDAAKDELDKAAQAKKDEIDASGMTDEEKKAAKDKVDAELAAGKEAIDKATDESGVNAAESSAKTNIGNISIDPVGGNTDSGSFPWWILAVIAGALLLLILLIVVIVKRRQVADGEDEYDDFYDDEYDFDEENYEEEDFGEDF